jgi:hypothetical protein
VGAGDFKRPDDYVADHSFRAGEGVNSFATAVVFEGSAAFIVGKSGYNCDRLYSCLFD